MQRPIMMKSVASAYPSGIFARSSHTTHEGCIIGVLAREEAQAGAGVARSPASPPPHHPRDNADTTVLRLCCRYKPTAVREHFTNSVKFLI
ncbi:hypothetical protein EVAR_81292_1 [Eumeta japonica]|uniref:Uncharacterized protein n=1 Tax=Eumeta variegata TaxID=151549 RepID=A0A4C1W1L3_EUMVA|nr:hypothetical protein EVAR_81292_1 [Eumeta japonica]